MLTSNEWLSDISNIASLMRKLIKKAPVMSLENAKINVQFHAGTIVRCSNK